MYKLYFKRPLDLIFSVTLFIFISPLFLITAIILGIYYRGSPFFTQNRPGFQGKTFKLMKFKSMIEKFDDKGVLLPDDQRITAFGKFIRKTSLDEMPQLLNIMLGDMSFIGPRPLLISYLPYYTDREHLRHSVRPGISGLAQVNGRNNLEFPQRLQLDIKYVENILFMNDVKIALQTVKNVLSGKDIVVVPSSAMLKDYRERNPNWKGIGT